MGIEQTLFELLPTLITTIVMVILLEYIRGKIQRCEKEGKEKRGWLLFEVAVILAISVFVPYKLLGFWIGYTLGLGLGIILLPIAAFLSIYFMLAPNNCSFTFVKEGTAKYVVRGDKFEKCLIQWKGHTFDEEWNVVPENTWVKDGKVLEVIQVIDEKTGKLKVRKADGTEEGIEGAKKYKEPWHPFGGLRFYGIWPILDIHIYKFRWTGVTERGEEQHKEEWLDFILLQEYTYKCTVERAEDADLLPLDLDVWLPTLIVNPRKARFDVQDWLETVIKRLQPPLRQLIAQDVYKNLIMKLQKLSKAAWQSHKKIGLGGPEGEFVKRYGVWIRGIEVRQIKPPDAYLKTTLEEFVAKQEAKATIAKAEGEKKAIILRAEGEEERLAKVYTKIQSFGDLGKLARTLEAMEKSPLAASVTIQAIPGLPEILRGIFGKPPEEATLKEIRELRSIVEKMLKTQEKK